jgi:predicted N-acetyltransferase YhbS
VIYVDKAFHRYYRRAAMAKIEIIPLDSVDPALVEELLDHAFGTKRKQRTAYRVREGLDWLPALSFAALDEDDMLAGTIQCWPVALTDPQDRRHPMIMAGPVAVLPELQMRGFGKALMAACLGSLDVRAPLPQVMIGDPKYYARFWDFVAEHTGDWKLPGPCEAHRLLARSDNPAILPRKGMLGPWRG